jgi:hypothetical protein
MKKYNKFFIILFFCSFGLIHFGCTGVLDAITNLQRLQFKLGRVTNLSLAGVNVSNVSSISNINLVDAANLLASFTRGQLPASFTLNVLAKNPNDGTGGTKNASAVLQSLAWRLLIDNKETVKGNIPNQITIPGVGQEVTIPIVMSLDLLQFFQNQGYENLLNLALAIGGRSGSSARLTLMATPTVNTVLGPITYPGEISIVDREFRGE